MIRSRSSSELIRCGSDPTEVFRQAETLAAAVKGVVLRIPERRTLMPDGKSKASPHDAARININEDYEVRYWTKKFGCSAAKLSAAVQKVGTSAEKKVEQYLKP